ncbi:MAG: quinone-dependent dihydroorotate dehydrogenase [Saprospiraceae bacterium]|nr:quinone-dependent dihydroorotate dehydrogenase [Saprospiraceae bacterium]
MYKFLIKPLLFLYPPEKAHRISMRLLAFVLSFPVGIWIFKFLFRKDSPALQRNLLGLTFANPIGLAAGFDKDGKYWKYLKHLGFGFIEIGTITPKPQPGNDKPRLFRLQEDEALLNRMGFNNDGVNAMADRLNQDLAKHKGNLIIGGNIGKNKATPNESAWRDYETCFKALYDYVDYFAVNVSSPNTPGLRELHDKEPLTKLLLQLKLLNDSYPTPKPILLKIAPDLTDQQLDDIIEIIDITKISGIIATNTTINRDNLQSDSSTLGSGGVSGKPLSERSTEVIRYLHTRSNGAFAIIGVGGIHSVADALEKLQAGASLVQIYTGLIYEGPSLIKKINKAIATKK